MSMTKKADHTLQERLKSGEFRFARLDLPDINNKPVIEANVPDIVEQEICLFHRSVQEPMEYMEMLDAYVRNGISQKMPSPVVRFADGEYAFYHFNLGCNGLYKQAESIKAIRRALPIHLDALRRLAETGKFAPLVFPGNVDKKNTKGILHYFVRSRQMPSASSFWEFLHRHGVLLNGDNYLPFYCVYAYLTSEAFARAVDGRKLCILNSEYNPKTCQSWFSIFSGRPEIEFVEIPSEYIATHWGEIRLDVLAKIPTDVDICLVGAGVGALLVCVEVAERFSVPAIDAGHILNMMNGREDKSKGDRMFTLRKSRQLLSNREI